MGNRISQRIKNQERLQLTGFGQVELSAAASGTHQDAHPNPGIFCCLQIADSIADKERRGKVERITFPGLEEQARFRFSTITVFLGGVRADERVIHPPAGCRDLFQDRGMDLHRPMQRNDSPANRRLVGDQDNFEWRVVKKPQRLQSLGKEDHILPGANVMVAIFNNHAVPVEE